MRKGSIIQETRGRKPDLVRRAAIAIAYEREGSLRKVAKMFNISHARVSKIVQAARANDDPLANLRPTWNEENNRKRNKR